MLFEFNAAEVFQIAVGIEENGRIFYEKCLDLTSDPELRELFSDLAVQEKEHKKKFEQLRDTLPREASSPVIWDPENELDQYIKMMADQHVFVSPEGGIEAKIATIKDVREALKLAMEFEKDSVIFFLTLQDATAGEKGRELISVLVKEEQEHLRRLARHFNKLKK
jgi:rubrerythrin